MCDISENLALDIDLGNSSGTRDLESIKRDIVNVVEQIRHFKDRVSKYIAENYVDFLPNNSSVYMHLEEGKHLEKESSALLMSLQWAYSNAELKATMNWLQQTVWDLQMTNRILAADEIFQYVEEAKSTKEYMVILDLLKKLNMLMEDCEVPEVQTMLNATPCYDTMRIKYMTQLHLVKKEIQDKFQRLLQFSEKNLPNLVCATIQVSKDVNQVQDTVAALFQAQYDISGLCDFLMDKCLTPIVTKPVTVSFTEEECSEYLMLQISYSTSETIKHEYKQVFENIKLLFNCLESLNILISTQHHVFGIIGDHIRDKFLRLLIDKCLMDAIPPTLEAHKSSTVVEDVYNFEHYLADLFFLNRESDRTLGNFADRFENLFRNNIFRSLLDSGREIMKRDLQDMIPVAEKNTIDDVANVQLLFPKCMISKSAMDFVKLLNGILRQDCENTESNSLPHTIVLVLINSYISLVPQFHKDRLELLPQPAIVFYNNCYFLHHWMAKQFDIPTVSSIVKTLSAMGRKYLRTQISKQLNTLKSILRVGVSTSSDNSIIPIAMVRNCLLHLKLLESLWQHVLPHRIYNQTMVELVSYCSLILNQNIMAKEKITTFEVKQITDLMNLFKSQAETVFKDPKELLNVNDWLRLVNMLKILDASLPEISEMWREGNLPQYFKPKEVIHLIRSLHPNTERRALTLKKIF